MSIHLRTKLYKEKGGRGNQKQAKVDEWLIMD